MERRELDEQLNNLKFDMDDEIDDRNERQGRRPTPQRAYQSMDTSHAIILAAIIIVGGLWGGKLVYDYIQEQRMKAAINEASAYMQQAFKEVEKSTQQMQAKMRQRTIVETKEREQLQSREQDKRQAELAREQQEKQFQSAQCQFWWQQHSKNPTERTAQRKADACNG